MSEKIFTAGRTVDSVAYDLALVMATKNESANSAHALLTSIKSYLPECKNVAEKFYQDETPPPPTNMKMKIVR